jgi:putative ABC transport system permease protein
MENRQKIEPPHWAKYLLERITAPHLREEIEGDMDELFHKRGQRYGYSRAKLTYILDLMLLLHPRLWRRQAKTHSNLVYSK